MPKQNISWVLCFGSAKAKSNCAGRLTAVMIGATVVAETRTEVTDRFGAGGRSRGGAIATAPASAFFVLRSFRRLTQNPCLVKPPDCAHIRAEVLRVAARAHAVADLGVQSTISRASLGGKVQVCCARGWVQ